MTGYHQARSIATASSVEAIWVTWATWAECKTQSALVLALAEALVCEEAL